MLKCPCSRTMWRWHRRPCSSNSCSTCIGASPETPPMRCPQGDGDGKQAINPGQEKEEGLRALLPSLECPVPPDSPSPWFLAWRAGPVGSPLQHRPFRWPTPSADSSSQKHPGGTAGWIPRGWDPRGSPGAALCSALPPSLFCPRWFPHGKGESWLEAGRCWTFTSPSSHPCW